MLDDAVGRLDCTLELISGLGVCADPELVPPAELGTKRGGYECMRLCVFEELVFNLPVLYKPYPLAVAEV